MKSIADELATLQMGDAAHFGSITLFPLFRTESGLSETDYLLLDEAIVLGTARVTELDGGSVPQLRFENAGELPVLLLDGEELIGAKQNRALNLTVLAPAKQTIVIPVSCVEAGRWAVQSENFKPAPHVMYSKVRAARGRQVTASMAATGARHSNQAAVWEEIEAKSERIFAVSPTSAMSAMYERHAVSIDAYRRAFSWSEGQAGILFCIGAQAMGLDLLDRPDKMRVLFPKLLSSYALDAIEVTRSTAASKERAIGFLDQIGKLSPLTGPGVGLGKDVRLTGDGASGSGLWANDRYVHLCAFTTDGIAPIGVSSRMNRPTRRHAM